MNIELMSKILKHLNKVGLAFYFFFIFSNVSAQWIELNGLTNINQPFQPISGGTADKQGNIYALLSSTAQASKNYIAKWDGAAWSEIANTKTNTKYEQFLRVFPDNKGSIYASCFIDNNTNNPRIGLVKWDGLVWKEIITFNQLTYFSPDGYKPIVDMPHCFNNSGDLYFVVSKAKSFLNQDTIIQTLYLWNNVNLTVVYQSIRPANPGPFKEIFDIKCDSHDNLFACGGFNNSQSYTVVKWSGTSWVELYGLNHLNTCFPIYRLGIDDKDNIFTQAVAQSYYLGNYAPHSFYFAKWDGTKWLDLDPAGKLDSDYQIHSTAIDSAGNFYIASSSTDQQKYFIHKWNGNEWLKIDFPICNLPYTPPCGNAYELCFDKNQNLVAQGNFKNAKGDFYVAKYNRTQFVSIKETSDISADFSIYPNPTSNKLNFNLGNASTQKFNLSLTNGLGQTVFSKKDADLNEGLDISILNNGIYFLKIQNQNSQKTFKVVKE